MRDMIILITIVIFWFFLGTCLTYVFDDPLIKSSLVEGNSSYVIPIDTSGIAQNISDDDSTVYLFTPSIQTKTKGFVNMFIRMFTLRIPTVPQIPIFVNLIINFLNWILVLIGGLLVFRLFRHGGG